MSISRYVLSRAARVLPLGLQSQLKWTLMIPDQFASLRHMRRCGFDARVIVDVGAFVGKFCKTAKSVWPESQLVMFEPQPDKQPRLQAIAAGTPGVTLKQCLLGARAGDTMDFYLWESGSSMRHAKSGGELPSIKLTTERMDDVLKGTPFEKPDLVKIDVQGAEIDVMTGGQKTIEAAQAVILELSLVEEYEGAPLFHEMVAYMAQRGFRVWDICTIWRNGIKSMIEADVIFARPSCAAFNAKHYWKPK